MGKYVEVEIDLDDFRTDDLIEEVESRGFTVTEDDCVNTTIEDVTAVAEQVYWQIRDGAPASPELRELVIQLTGKIL